MCNCDLNWLSESLSVMSPGRHFKGGLGCAAKCVPGDITLNDSLNQLKSQLHTCYLALHQLYNNISLICMVNAWPICPVQWGAHILYIFMGNVPKTWNLNKTIGCVLAMLTIFVSMSIDVRLINRCATTSIIGWVNHVVQYHLVLSKSVCTGKIEIFTLYNCLAWIATVILL